MMTVWRQILHWPAIRGNTAYAANGDYSFIKTNIMHYHHACAANGEFINRSRQMNARSTQRANINVFKTDSTYEVLVFAPGRVKDHFQVEVRGQQLTVSYTPPEGFPRPEWVLREYSRGGFSRAIHLPDSIDASRITAKYTDGVLEISLPLLHEEKQDKVNIAVL